MLNPERKYLCVTHSARPLDLKLCNLNYLELRYSRLGRLPPEIPFEALTPAKMHSPYGGEVTIYDLGQLGRDAPRQVARLRPQFKPQHAVWHAGFLWVLGTEHIEVCDNQLRSVAHIEDPWLAGAHTAVPDGTGRMLISCSASDSVLVIDQASRMVVGTHRMPAELYGENYPLGRDDSVVDHYVINDLQITHLNCAAPWRGGILTSALIPGAIGYFGPDGVFKEMLAGFVGCHGARAVSDEVLYFCDSCLGALVLLDSAMRIRQRIDTGSKWLHDGIYLGDDIFALAVSDDAAVWFVNAHTRETIGKLDCAMYGPPQFLSY